MKLIEHYVGGKIIPGSSEKKGKVFNPATGEQESEVRLASKSDLDQTVEIAKKAPNGSVILCMLPDTAERYMSSPLFESIESEMDTEELNISKSTPGFQIPDQ